MDENKILNELIDVYNALFSISNASLIDMSSFSVDDLKDKFNKNATYLKTMHEAITQHEPISFLHNTPIIPGVGLLGIAKQNIENKKFISCLDIKIFEDKGIHQLTRVIGEKVLELCSIQVELKKKGYTDTESNVIIDKIKFIYSRCVVALNSLSNDVFAYNYEVQGEEAQLWGLLDCAYKHCIELMGPTKKKGFFRSLFG